MLRYYRSAIFHNWKCLYFCQFLLELLLTILVRKFFFPAEFVCEVWKGFWCLTVITGLWTNRKKILSLNSDRRNLFLKVWMPKAFGLVIGRYLPCFSLPTCDYFTQLRRLLHFFNQSAVEIQYETSRACMLFPRLPLVDSSFASRTLQFFCCETCGVDFNKARLGTSHVSRLCVHTSSCKRRKRRHLLLSFRERHKSV